MPELVDTYVLMESFKRKNDFLNFCAQLFKQIEGIANHICEIQEYGEIFVALFNCPSLCLFENGVPLSITSSRKQDSETIAKLIFSEYERTKEGKDKRDIKLKNQYIQDRIKIAMYFAGYASSMYSSSEFKTFSYDLSKLYLARCEADHSGNGRSEKQEIVFQEVINNFGKYYVEFTCLLNLFIQKISSGYSKREELHRFACSYGVEDFGGVVSSSLPGALYVKVGEDKAESVPPTAYDHKTKFDNGMKVRVTRKHGTIVNVIPCPQEDIQ